MDAVRGCAPSVSDEIRTEPLYAAEARRRMLAGKSDPSQNLDEGSRIRTDERLAQVAGVSRGTIRKVKATLTVS